MRILVGEAPFNASSRAANYGDGCFTTAQISDGKVELLSLHIQRLQHAANVLKYRIMQQDWDALVVQINEVAGQTQQGILKVVLCAEDGGRGYARIAEHALAFVRGFQSEDIYALQRQKGVTLQLSNFKLSNSESLSGLKHLNRLDQVMAKTEPKDKQVFDLVLCDEQGMLVETTSANLFWSNGKSWFTPELTKCGVDGVMRNHLLRLLSASGTSVYEVAAVAKVLKAAKAVFLCNSLMKVVPVTKLIGQNGEWEVEFNRQPIQNLQKQVIHSLHEN
ncbi:MAG: aminodeoxychorismate lyase [Alteromonadaceae bacterium]|nr:aminodeoxychorismate lyase [Alteromonadaceae bacterium]